jgi:hypothetical protein
MASDEVVLKSTSVRALGARPEMVRNILEQLADARARSAGAAFRRAGNRCAARHDDPRQQGTRIQA